MRIFSPRDVINDKYVVINLLGEGGLSRVYLVKIKDNIQQGKKFAMKVTRSMNEFGFSKEEVHDMYMKEVSMLAMLKHPNIPAIEEHFIIDENHYLIEEFISGITLEEFARHRRLGERDAILIALTLCDLLIFLHRKNIILRDLKPSNIMLVASSPRLEDYDMTYYYIDGIPQIKVIDFGIARSYKKGATADTMIVGTPGYAAPETYGSSQSDARSDIFSLGATLHYVLTGIDPQNHPFMFEPIEHTRPEVTREFIKIVQKALDIDPVKRYSSASEMKKSMRFLGFLCGYSNVNIER